MKSREALVLCLYRRKKQFKSEGGEGGLVWVQSVKFHVAKFHYIVKCAVWFIIVFKLQHLFVILYVEQLLVSPETAAIDSEFQTPVLYIKES